jgi:hypothetical protein
MVPRPNPARLGGLEWVRSSRGQLTGAERRRLLVAIAIGQFENLAGRVKLTLGRLPDSARDIDVRLFEPPDSRLAPEAEAACVEQPEAIAGHSYRTWMYGLALAALDGATLDRELFYCASLVHDFGISPSVAGRDFTLGGADRALAGQIRHAGRGTPGPVRRLSRPGPAPASDERQHDQRSRREAVRPITGAAHDRGDLFV